MSRSQSSVSVSNTLNRCLLDVNFTGSHLLVSRTGGFAHLVSVVQDDRKGKTDHEYSLKDEAPGACGHGAMFTNGGQTVIFGAVQGCLLIWDKEKVISGLDHGDGEQTRTNCLSCAALLMTIFRCRHPGYCCELL